MTLVGMIAAYFIVAIVLLTILMMRFDNSDE